MSRALIGDDIGDDLASRVLRRDLLPPLLPKDFKAQHDGNGVRLSITERDTYGDRSSATMYVFGWAKNVDTSTQAGRDVGAQSVEMCDHVAAPQIVDRVASTYLLDAKFQTGTFFCWAMDPSGNRSDQYLWSQLITGEILDSSIPGEVTHVQVSGSGDYLSNDVVEMISISCVVPRPLGSFDGVQPFYQDYISVGTMVEGDLRRYNGAEGGSMQFQVPMSLAKKAGTGTISLTAGSANVTGANFLVDNIRAGDEIGQGGTLGVVDHVVDGANLVLTAVWGGKTVAAATDYAIYRKITIYLVSVSKGGTHRTDVTNAPSASLVFDGQLGTPNGPASVLATTAGNVIRLEFQAVLGTKIKGYKLYRGTGAGQAFASCSYLDQIPQPKGLTDSTLSFVQFEDSSFTISQREQGQVFTYYVTTLSEAPNNNESAPTHALNADGNDPSCRLDAPADTSPQVPAGATQLNLLWDGHIAGTVGNAVANGDASQDAYMAGGGAPPAGFSRWNGVNVGAGSTVPGHQSVDEVILPQPNGAAGDLCYIEEMIGAWNAAAGSQRIQKGVNLTLQAKGRTSGGQPNGSLALEVQMQLAGTPVGSYGVMQRLSTDLFDYSATRFSIAGSTMTTDFALYFATFSYRIVQVGSNLTGSVSVVGGNTALLGDANTRFLTELLIGEVINVGGTNATILAIADDQHATFTVGFGGANASGVPATVVTLSNVDKLAVRIYHIGTNNGVNVLVKQAMLSFGNTLPAWNPAISTSLFPNGTGPISRNPRDDDGNRRGRIPIAA